MAALPYMPLYVADYLADTAHLSTQAHGAYLLLIMNYWQRGEALPCEDRKLARIARMTDEEWAGVRGDIAEFFNETIAGTWQHGRIEAELNKVREKSEKASSAGKASAQRRSNERSTDVQQTFNHTDTDTDTDTDTEKKETTRAMRADAPSGFIEFWAQYPNRIGRGAAVKAFVKARSKADQATIMAGLARYAAKQDDRPWCNPATWLNQERWLDAPAAQGPPRAAAQQPVKEHRNADFIRNLAKIHQRDPSNPANHSRPTDAAPAASDAGLPDSGVDRTIELDASYAEWRRS
jgi:uncharacterized protein YdaU (DUF1376 family)